MLLWLAAGALLVTVASVASRPARGDALAVVALVVVLMVAACGARAPQTTGPTVADRVGDVVQTATEAIITVLVAYLTARYLSPSEPETP